MKKPIKRHDALKPLSREHHHGLLLCWKIRQGKKLNVEVQRMKNYADWFKKTYLKSHFEAEEKYIFPILGEENELVQQALAEHRRLESLFDQENHLEKALNQIAEELDLHIRFEERLLFNEVQKIATAEQLNEVKKHHNGINFSDDNWQDHFWTR
jgi:iron-sulfur cluster repair protein YtfE (RIC family)